MTALQRYSTATAVLCMAVVMPMGGIARAQFDNGAIARLYDITGAKAVPGDLISFDRASQTFARTHVENDANLFGVVVSDPVLVLQTAGGGVPVVSTGEVRVNVTTLAGPIKAGDQLTSSVVPGKAQLAVGGGGVVLGTALESFPGPGVTTTAAATTSVYEGSVRVLLGIGPRLQVATTTTSVPPATPDAQPLSSLVAKVLKYMLAALVATGSVFAAFRNFGASIRDGIVSVGRNPLAKSSIQSMVILNSVLIILVSAAGLFVGFAILLLPL